LFTKYNKKVQRHVIVIINYLPQFLLFYQTIIFRKEYFSRWENEAEYSLATKMKMIDGKAAKLLRIPFVYHSKLIFILRFAASVCKTIQRKFFPCHFRVMTSTGDDTYFTRLVFFNYQVDPYLRSTLLGILLPLPPCANYVHMHECMRCVPSDPLG